MTTWNSNNIQISSDLYALSNYISIYTTTPPIFGVNLILTIIEYHNWWFPGGSLHLRQKDLTPSQMCSSLHPLLHYIKTVVWGLRPAPQMGLWVQIPWLCLLLPYIYPASPQTTQTDYRGLTQDCRVEYSKHLVCVCVCVLQLTFPHL